MHNVARAGLVSAAVLATVWITACGSSSQPSAPVQTPIPTALVLLSPDTEYLAALSTTSPTLTPVTLSPVSSNIYAVDAVTHHVISLEYFIGTPHNYYGCDANNIHAFTVNPSTGSRTEIAAPATTSQLLLPDVQGKFLFDLHCAFKTVGNPDFMTFSDPLGVDVWTIAGDQFTPVTGSPFGDATVLLAEHPSGKFLYVEGSAGIEVLSVGSGGELAQTSAITSPSGVSGMVLSPSGQHAYLAYVPDPVTGFSIINVYTVNLQDGSLTLQSSFATGSFGFQIVMHPSGSFLYGNNGMDILNFPIDSAGNLQTPTVIPNVVASDIAFNKAGNFAFVSQGFPISLGMFSVDPTNGEFTGINNTPPLTDASFYVYVIE